MKSVQSFLMLVFIFLSAVSCNDVDDLAIDVEKKKLTVVVENDSIIVGSALQFHAEAEGVKVDNVDFYVDNVLVEDFYRFDANGVYFITAKKTGYYDSDPLQLAVFEKNNPLFKKLRLLADTYTPKVGRTVIFSVIRGQEVDFDAEVHQVGGGVIDKWKWTPTEEGRFEFFAVGTGALDSEIIVLKVLSKDALEKNYIRVEGVKDVSIVQTHLYVEGSKQTGKATVFISTDQTTKYLRYHIISHGSINDYSDVILDVIIPDNASSIVWPSDVQDDKKIVRSIHYSIDHEIHTMTELFDYKSFYWWDKPTSPNLGSMSYSLRSEDIQVSFEGKYDGIYLLDEISKKPSLDGTDSYVLPDL